MTELVKQFESGEHVAKLKAELEQAQRSMQHSKAVITEAAKEFYAVSGGSR